MKLILGLCVPWSAPAGATTSSPLTRRAMATLAATPAGVIKSTLPDAIERERRQVIEGLWDTTSAAGGTDLPVLSSVQRRQVERLLEVLEPELGRIDADTRLALARLAARTPARWKQSWIEFRSKKEDSLDDVIDTLAEVFGRTVRHARAMRDVGNPAEAHAASLDALRVLSQAYFVLGSAAGNRAELCDEASRYQLVVGALGIGGGLPLTAMAIATAHPGIMMIAAILGFVGAPATYAGFANTGRQFDATTQPLGVPPTYRRFHQRRIVDRVQRSFWLLADAYAGPDLVAADASPGPNPEAQNPWESLGGRVPSKILSSLASTLARDGATQFCARVLGSGPPAVAPPPPTVDSTPSIFFFDDEAPSRGQESASAVAI